MAKKYSIEDIKDAYESGYYEGAGDDAWYRDHTNSSGDLNEDAFVHRPMEEYVKEINGIKWSASFEGFMYSMCGKYRIEPICWNKNTIHDPAYNYALHYQEGKKWCKQIFETQQKCVEFAAKLEATK